LNAESCKGLASGYVGTGWWFNSCAKDIFAEWLLFWGGMTLAMLVILIYFLIAYRGQCAQAGAEC
jgi:hypothetical protein